METYLTFWWIWICIALALGVAELLLPGFIFLGFAIGALGMALAVLVLPASNVAALLALFAFLSLIAWIGLRFFFRRGTSNARIFTHDVNED